MISVIKKYLPFALLLMILILLPFEWYNQLYANKQTFIFEDVNGVFVFTNKNWIIAIIYFYSILIQFFCIIYRNSLLPILTDIILIISLTLFPASMYDFRISWFYSLTKLNYGYYLALALIICSLVININSLIKNKTKLAKEI